MAKITKIIKGILPKDLGALGNLKEPKDIVPLDKKQEVVPAGRRDFLKRAGGTVAQSLMPRGALTNLVEKGLESVETKPDIPINRFKNKLINSMEFKKASIDDMVNEDPSTKDLIEEFYFREAGDSEEFINADSLSDEDVNNFFNYTHGIQQTPNNDYLPDTEQDYVDEIKSILKSYNLTPEKFVKRKQQTQDLLGLFVNRLKKSGYKDPEITEFLEIILEDD